MTETITHTIEIDDNISVNLKIPKTLNILELQGLMEKSRKFMQIAQEKQQPIHKSRGKRYQFSDEMIQYIKDAHKKGKKNKQIREGLKMKYNTQIGKQSIYNKINVLKSKGEL